MSPTASPKKAYILPITSPANVAELGQLDNDRGRVVAAMRAGYASVLMALEEPERRVSWDGAMAEAARVITDEPCCTTRDLQSGVCISAMRMPGVSDSGRGGAGGSIRARGPTS